EGIGERTRCDRRVCQQPDLHPGPSPRREASPLSHRPLPPGKRGRRRRDRPGRVSGRGRGGGGGVGREGASFSPGGAADDFSSLQGREPAGAHFHRKRSPLSPLDRTGQKKFSMEGDPPEWIKQAPKKPRKSRRR